jgi:GntR family transcriptional repressor for pyruvate dehydrogenase complex
MPDEQSNGLRYHLLQLTARRAGEPLGAGTLEYLLDKSGTSVSSATVGRMLKRLELEGLLKKVGQEGRVITEEGERQLAMLDQERNLRMQGERLLEQLSGSRDRNSILALLEARRPIEKEVCRLAALRAGDEDIKRIRDDLERQRQVVEVGGLAIEEDIVFHEHLAEAADNPYFKVLVSLLRRHGRLAEVIATIRKQSGGRFAVEHDEILAAVATHDPDAAERAADQHILRLRAEVEAFLPDNDN